MASLKALAARLASQACDHVALPARATVTLQYVFPRPTRDVGPASASLHASRDTTAAGGDPGARSASVPPGPPRRPTSAPQRRLTRRTGQRFTSPTSGDSGSPGDPSAAQGPPQSPRSTLARISPHFAPRTREAFYLPFRSSARQDPRLFSVDGGGMWGTVERNGGGWRREVRA